MTNRGIWIVDGNRMIRYIPIARPPTVRQRLTAWVKTVCQRIIVWLAVLALLAGCAPLRPGNGVQGPQVPGVLVNDAGRCKATRSVLFDRPAGDVWSAGCR